MKLYATSEYMNNVILFKRKIKKNIYTINETLYN